MSIIKVIHDRANREAIARSRYELARGRKPLSSVS